MIFACMQVPTILLFLPTFIVVYVVTTYLLSKYIVDKYWHLWMRGKILKHYDLTEEDLKKWDKE